MAALQGSRHFGRAKRRANGRKGVPTSEKAPLEVSFQSPFLPFRAKRMPFGLFLCETGQKGTTRGVFTSTFRPSEILRSLPCGGHREGITESAGSTAGWRKAQRGGKALSQSSESSGEHSIVIYTMACAGGCHGDSPYQGQTEIQGNRSGSNQVQVTPKTSYRRLDLLSRGSDMYHRVVES